ncbi:hypothetical protein INS49_011704 [Diaporthe citri]|uniref:uncharacterized protein n=1 Tax=Diaporthe citri TaxID=83186 RepID=UPI001C81B9D8|nr:uncharacterized protein INS49_011704 [Diaporthe citri]KAG6360639.1 hypothetical protein INS49_011704 [Diaporthe citri]
MTQPKTDEIPPWKAVDIDQFINKANLAFSKRSANLSHLLKPRASSPAKPKLEDHGAEKPRFSFSSLANKPSPHTSLKKSQQQRKTFSQPRVREKDGDDDNEAPLNSGIGHVPSGEEAAGDSRAAETRDLKGKLLGKRALEQREEARKKRARAKPDSSDEEEGRSAAVGKGRKKKGRKGGAD